AFFHFSGNAGSNGNMEFDDYIYNDVMFVPSANAPNLVIDLTYTSGSPLPPGGANLNFGVFVSNNGAVALDYNAWLDIVHEGGAPSTVVLRSFTNYQPGWQINRPDMFFPVPGGYAAGDYMFYGRIGADDQVIWAQSGFPFEKSGTLSDIAFIPYVPKNVPDVFGEVNEEIIAVAPEEFQLHGAYPNPFNPTTELSYELRVAGSVLLSVYDIQGREVAKLVDGFRDAGVHEATFDATGLTSGVYLVKLIAGDQKAISRIILMK
ncbi:T9SS type A sorting domain-containing protein, partial [bacterium]|nr:T9SS type A sorting domain-containing protein [bacterium]